MKVEIGIQFVALIVYWNHHKICYFTYSVMIWLRFVFMFSDLNINHK